MIADPDLPGEGGKVRPAVVLYTRRNCHLCDAAKEVLEAVRGRVALDLAVIDVDTDPALAEKFGHEVPVVFVNGRKAFKFKVDAAILERKLRAG